MRIKEVCRETNLTDKAIRFYINNGLVSPNYTENYSGRKNYDFQNEDIELLKKIALLRKYSFSVSDIKELIYNEKSIDEVLSNQINIVSNNAAETSFVLTNLKNAFEKSPDSLSSLCDILNENIEPSSFDINDFFKKNWLKVKNKLPTVFLSVLAGFVFSAGLIVLITVLLSKYLSTLA